MQNCKPDAANNLKRMHSSDYFYDDFESIIGFGSPLIVSIESESDYSSVTADLSNSNNLSDRTIHSSSRKAGRYKIAFTVVLEQFFTKQGQRPKREFFNIFITRCIKRLYKALVKGKVPKKTAIAINLNSAIHVQIWNNMKKIYANNKQKIIEINGANDRDRCNITYMKHFFQENVNKIMYVEIIKLLFTDNDLNVLKDKFNFFCCRLEEHDRNCFESWNNLKFYLENDYLRDFEKKDYFEKFENNDFEI